MSSVEENGNKHLINIIFIGSFSEKFIFWLLISDCIDVEQGNIRNGPLWIWFLWKILTFLISTDEIYTSSCPDVRGISEEQPVCCHKKYIKHEGLLLIKYTITEWFENLNDLKL